MQATTLAMIEAGTHRKGDVLGVARLAGIMTWRIWDKLMEDLKVEYFPNVKSVDEYRFRLESTLRYPLLKNLSLNLIVVDLYDTQAPPGVQNNDLQVRSALGIKF